jgi:hypothetical protein
MLTVEDARRIALEYVHKKQPDCGLISEEFIPSPFGWYFHSQSNRYIQTRDYRDLLIGSGGFFVDGTDGTVFALTSGLFSHEGRDWWLDAYSRGFRLVPYELTIESVKDRGRTIDLLASERLTFVLPAVDGDTVWRIPQTYTPERIAERLDRLPCTFSRVEVYSLVRLVDRFREEGCCGFSYRPRAARDPKDLEPEW